MKRIAILFLTVISTVVAVKAQSSKVVTAYKYLNDYKRDNDIESLTKAKEAIDLAAEHPDTKDQAKTQLYRGQIYFTLYDSKKRAEEDKLSKIADPNKRAFAALENTPTEDLATSYQAYLKAKQLDVKGNYASDLKAAIGNIGVYYDNVGRVNYNMKKYDIALNAFETTYEVSEFKDTTALSFAALAADLGKNYDKAKLYYQKMIEKKMGNGNTYSSLLNVYLMLNDTTAGMDILKKGRAMYPNDINLLITETNFFLKTNNSKEALSNLNIAIQAKPTDYNLYLVRGNIYDNLANPKDASGKDLEKPADYNDKMNSAEADYKKAIELKPDYFDALYNLGVLYNNKGVAISKKADAITDNAKYAAENAKATAEYTKAAPVLEKALAVNPTDKGTMVALKQIYARTQQLDKLKEINLKLKN